MKIETINILHKTVDYTSMAVVAGGIAVAIAPTALSLTIAGVAATILGAYTNRAFRDALDGQESVTNETKWIYLGNLKSKFTPKKIAILVTFIGVMALCCARASVLLAPPPQAIRRI